MRQPLLLAFLLLILCLATGAGADPLRVIREVDHDHAIGAPFPPGAGIQLEVAPGSAPVLSWVQGGQRERVDPRNVSFARDGSGVPWLIAFDARSGALLELRGTGAAVVAATRRIPELAVVRARGIALNAANDRLFVLEASRILVLDGVGKQRPRVEWIALPKKLPALGGLAFDPATGHLFALAPERAQLLELALDGRLVALHFLPDDVHDVRAIAIAPSSDATDAPERQSLFVAIESPGGGSTLELSLEPLALAAAPTITPTLLSTVLTSNFSPPSPDPDGVAVIGSRLLISDSEVDEMSIYQGANLFETTTSGVLLSTSDTTFYSHEPTGITRNPANGHIFTSDDDKCRVYEVTPGADNRITPDDTVRNFKAPASCDWEEVAYGDGSLWIVDGVDAEVLRYQPGPNGVFDGGGDDVITHFDTEILGLTDPEGIAFDTDGGNLYVVGKPANRIAHISSSGTLLRWLDTTAAHAVKPAGLAYGPGPAGDPTRRLYMVARGVDNDTDPNENDGKLFIFGVTPLASANQPPSVAAGPDASVLISEAASLDGTVSDDGQPNPPGAVTTSWSKVSGPGTVTFANASSVDTTATFSAAGTYVLRLTVDDSVAQTSDDVTITITPARAFNDTYVVAKGISKDLAVLANDIGFNDPVTVTITSPPNALGTAVVEIHPGQPHNVVIEYQPYCCRSDAAYTESFVYRVTDGESTDSATVTINVISDADDDSVPDDLDNCLDVPNPDQRDTNGDGYGNLCDPDLDNNGVVNINDFNRLKSRLGVRPVVDVDADLDGNGTVNINDLNRLKGYLGRPAGPSGLHP